MDFEEVARSTVETVAGRLAQRATDAGGRLTDTALDGVYQLISHRLSGSATGRRALGILVRDPADRQNRARVAEMVTDEAGSDGQFAEALGRAVTNAGIVVQGQGANHQHTVRDHSGDFRNITVRDSQNVKFKKYHIGNIRFGTGGLVAGILMLTGLAGGGTAAVVAATAESVELASAVGEWTQADQSSIPGFTVGPVTLTVSADGRFVFVMRASMDVPMDVPDDVGLPSGFGDLSLDCAGTVTPDGDHFTLRTTSGPCGTFQAKPGPDNILDVFIDNGSANGSVALTKSS